MSALPICAWNSGPSVGPEAGSQNGPAPRPFDGPEIDLNNGPNLPSPAFTHEDLMRCNTGNKISAEKYRDSSSRQAKLANMTNNIADKLESRGITARTGDGDVTAIGDVTGVCDTVEQFRSICFLPLIAQRDRKPILNDLLYFQKHNKLGKYLRYAVITSGERIPLYGDVRGTMQDLSREISKFADEADKLFNVAVIFRGSEFTIDDDITFHVHANVLYAPRKALKGEKWKEFLSWAHNFLSAHWKDNGVLKEPREAIKYPFKPLDLNKLDAKATAWLYEETKRLKIVSPLREFREFRQSLEYEHIESETVDLETGEITTTIDKVERETKYKTAMVTTPRGPMMAKVAKQKRQPQLDTPPDNREISNENLIICRTAPQFRNSPYMEPITMVQSYTENPVTSEGKRRLDKINANRAEAREWWNANGAPSPAVALNYGKGQRAAALGEAGKVRSFNVHTSRSTVQKTDAQHYSNLSPGAPGKGNHPTPDDTREHKILKFEKTAENQPSGNSPTP